MAQGEQYAAVRQRFAQDSDFISPKVAVITAFDQGEPTGEAGRSGATIEAVDRADHLITRRLGNRVEEAFDGKHAKRAGGAMKRPGLSSVTTISRRSERPLAATQTLSTGGDNPPREPNGGAADAMAAPVRRWSAEDLRQRLVAPQRE